MKLRRDLEITYKYACLQAHRMRKAFQAETPKFEAPVEVDKVFS